MTFRLRVLRAAVGVALAATVFAVPVIAVAAAVTAPPPANIVTSDGGTYHDI